MNKLIVLTTVWLYTSILSCEPASVASSENTLIEVIPPPPPSVPLEASNNLYTAAEIELKRSNNDNGGGGGGVDSVVKSETISRGSPESSADKRAHLKMVSTNRLNVIGNPIYEIKMYKDGVNVGSVYGVSGRAWTQTRDRHVAGNESPLPNGRYSVSRSPIAGLDVEVGSLFLPVTPLFRTGRSALGFHVDPSYNKNNGEDGTAGCIGLTSVSERDQLFKFVKQNQVAYLDVSI